MHQGSSPMKAFAALMSKFNPHIPAFWVLLKETVNAFIDHNATRFGAALGFYTIFAISPLFIFAVAIAGFFFGPFGAMAGLGVGLLIAAAIPQRKSLPDETQK